ncbi:uncharacterized protein A4U43_C08F4980 [Asparagus officinalis]|nr:uncharacterized protein A4U43_C08F4980 [Asparagus officinalis]
MFLLSLPLIASIVTILFFRPSLLYVFEFTSKWTRLPPATDWYGKIFRSHLFGHPTVVSCDAEFNSFVLQNEGTLFHAGYPSNIPAVLGDLTLLFVTGDIHKRLRGFAVNLFSSIRTPNSSFLSGIEDNVLRVMESWKDKETLRFTAETRKFTFGVIVKQILSLEVEDPDALEILDHFTMFMKGLVSIPIKLPGTPYAKAIQNVDVATSKRFMPFGGGKRLCPGSELSRLETCFFIHHLVLNYSWTPLLDSDWPMHYPYIDFKDGLQLAIKPLSSAS